MSEPTLNKQQYDEFRDFLERTSAIVLGDNKHYLVTSRLNRLTREFSFPSLSAMLDALKREDNPVLKGRIIDAMTTNETSWFRDSYPYEILMEQLFPELGKKKSPLLRIWSSACSSGQESYSISMTISEFQQANPGALFSTCEIVATDISKSILQAAKAAQYEELSVIRGLSPERREKFFTHKDNRWEVKPEIRQRVRFTELNLMQSYVLLGKFDIIFCRNVLIYFSSPMKTDILDRMAQLLNPGGYLILGGSESPTGYSRAFEMVRFPQGVIYRLREGWKADR